MTNCEFENSRYQYFNKKSEYNLVILNYFR